MDDRTIYVFNGFRLDPARRVLSSVDGHPIPLTPKVFDTLLFFVERPFELIAKDALMHGLWPDCVVEENNLNADGRLRGIGTFDVPLAAARGRTYRLSGDRELAEGQFETARMLAEQALARTTDGLRSRTQHLTELGEALAGLGRTDEAVELGRDALEDVVNMRDAMDTAVVRMEVIVRVLIPAGAVDLALDELEVYFAGPGPWSVEGLSRHPEIRPIRDDARFVRLLTKFERQ